MSYFQSFICYRSTMHKQYFFLLLISAELIDEVKRIHCSLFDYYHSCGIGGAYYVYTRKLGLIWIKFNS